MVFNKDKIYPTEKFDLAYLKKKDPKQVTGKEIMLTWIHKQNRTMFMSYLFDGQQSGAQKAELHSIYRDENGKHQHHPSPNL